MAEALAVLASIQEFQQPGTVQRSIQTLHPESVPLGDVLPSPALLSAPPAPSLLLSESQPPPVPPLPSWTPSSSIVLTPSSVPRPSWIDPPHVDPPRAEPPWVDARVLPSQSMPVLASWEPQSSPRSPRAAPPTPPFHQEHLLHEPDAPYRQKNSPQGLRS